MSLIIKKQLYEFIFSPYGLITSVIAIGFSIGAGYYLVLNNKNNLDTKKKKKNTFYICFCFIYISFKRC